MTERDKEIVLLSDVTEKTTVSARVNSYIVKMYKESEIPISLVIESSLINFMKLDDDDKIRFISANLSDNVKVKDLKRPNKVWKDLLDKYFKDFAISRAATSALFSGIAVGAVALIGGVLAALDKNASDKK